MSFSVSVCDMKLVNYFNYHKTTLNSSFFSRSYRTLFTVPLAMMVTRSVVFAYKISVI